MLDVAILGLLLDGDLHGYELKKRLTDLMGPWSSVSFGSLYPALSRLERKGLVETVAQQDPAAAPPMSGSLGAELAAFRREPTTRRGTSSRRARKIYALTEAGRAALVEDLQEPSGDERTFAVRVAFCGVLDPEVRDSLFRRRRAEVEGRLASRRRATRAVSGPTNDPYRRSLLEFQDDRLRRELDWIDELLAPSGGADALEPTTPPNDQAPEATSLTPGGSPS
jgi:DNA-binding PadR family transcriptional regulator